jgi:para-nitrobenzyl esterase
MRSVTRWLVAIALLIGMTTTGCAGHGTSSAPSGRFPLVVFTDRGAVRGVASADGTVANFLGISYAAPPVGTLRWRPPRPTPAWNGIHAADRYRSVCAQPGGGDGPRGTAEECLYINVQRPALGDRRQRLPVYVFIHGGGLTSGAGSYFNMEKIVHDTGVIGVTFNYRLGVFGFLATAGLTAEQGESGNYGLLDQQAALRWVQRNIAAFGGDPLRVTIGGESAGGWSVCAHLVSPRSRRLFARAILQSGSCPTQTQTQAQATGSQFAVEAGCSTGGPGEAVACLRALSPAQLLDAQGSSGFTPELVRGTRTLPSEPVSAIRAGDFARVPVLIGGTRDEGRAFTSDYIGWSREDYENWVTDVFGGNAARVIAHYPWPPGANRVTPAYLTAAITTDAGIIGPAGSPIEGGIGGCGTQALIRAIARYARTYAYEWAPQTGPGIVTLRGYSDGAGHGSELAYLWPNFEQNGVRIASQFSPAERQLSDRIVQYWGEFVKAGSPGAGGRRPWPPYRTDSPVLLSLRARGQSTLVTGATIDTEHRCSFWNSLTPSR